MEVSLEGDANLLEVHRMVDDHLEACQMGACQVEALQMATCREAEGQMEAVGHHRMEGQVVAALFLCPYRKVAASLVGVVLPCPWDRKEVDQSDQKVAACLYQACRKVEDRVGRTGVDNQKHLLCPWDQMATAQKGEAWQACPCQEQAWAQLHHHAMVDL